MKKCIPLALCTMLATTAVSCDSAKFYGTANISSLPSSISEDAEKKLGDVEQNSASSMTPAQVSGPKNASQIVTVPSDAEGLRLTVSPASGEILIGGDQEYQAFIVDKNGTEKDVTSLATWSVSDPESALVVKPGKIAGKKLALLQVGVSYNNQSLSASLNIRAARLLAIAIKAASDTIDVGSVQDFTVTGDYEDGTQRDITNEVNVVSDASGIVELSGSGQLQALAAGVALITADKDGIAGSKRFVSVDTSESDDPEVPVTTPTPTPTPTAMPTVFVPPTCKLTASPTAVLMGSKTTLSLTSSGNVGSAAIDGVAIIGSAGSRVTPPIMSDTVFSAFVKGLGGSATCTVAVSVIIPTAGVSFSTTGLGLGTLQASPGNVQISTAFANVVYPVGTMITVTAVPTYTSKFAGWSSSGGNYCSGLNPVCTFKVPAISITIMATFSPGSPECILEAIEGGPCSVPGKKRYVLRRTLVPSQDWMTSEVTVPANEYFLGSTVSQHCTEPLTATTYTSTVTGPGGTSSCSVTIKP